MSRYCEIVRGKATNRGAITEISGSNMDIDCYDEEVVDGYNSIFMFPHEITNHMATYNSIANYRGKVSIDCLYWDMDNESLEEAYMDTHSLIKRLTEIAVNKDAIRIYFSGNKGFHVLLPSLDVQELGDREDLPQIVRDVVRVLAANLQSFDSVIYDKTRIFRTPNTKHSKTGLYKIGLTVDEFNSMDIPNIKEIARYKKLTPDTWGASVSNKRITILLKESMAGRLKPTSGAAGKFTYSELEQGMQDGFAKGKRNSGLTSVAGVLHRKGIGKNFVSSILHAINERAEKPLEPTSIDTIISSVCSYPIDPKFSQVSKGEIITLYDAGKRWKELRTRCQKLNTGFPHLDKHIMFFDPEQVLIVAARAGVGKTTLAMQLVNNMAQSLDGYALFVSLEMPTPSVFFRAATIDINKRGEVALGSSAIAKKLLSDDKEISKISDNWKKVLLVDKDSLSLEQIEQCYNMANERCGQRIEVLCVDYGGLIRGATDYNAISEIARGVKALAKRVKTRLVLVLQLSRAAGDGTKEVRMDYLRDTGAWEEAADYILGGWISEKDPNRIHVSILKNRFGERNAMFDLINKGLSYSTTDSIYRGGW